MNLRVLLIGVSLLLLLHPLAAQDSFPIQPGAVEGNINDAFPGIRYRVSLDAGQVATFSMQTTSGDLDPFLLLFDNENRLLADNDDAEAGQRNARIEFTAPEAGDYIVEATRFDQEQGSSTGTYRFIFSIAGLGGSVDVDPLSIRPDFGVNFALLEYGGFGTGRLSEERPLQYFVVGGRQGDFVRILFTRSSGDLELGFAFFNQERSPVRHNLRSGSGELAVYATLPVTGWYLIEANRVAGAGDYTVYAERLSEATIERGQTVSGEFSAATPSITYIFNATIGERIFVTLIASEADAAPQIVLMDLNETELLMREGAGSQARMRATIPRSGPYLLIARSTVARGTFELNLQTVPVDSTKLETTPIAYNNRYKGSVDDAEALAYYSFNGKAGELVSLEMRSDEDSVLDPYLILMDSTLTELASNDNAGATRNARIAQFALPQDGAYFVLATRAGMEQGSTRGGYSLEITVGQIALTPGALSATLRWTGDADLNLFMRGPGGRTVSWSNPAAGGGILQIDSNTKCQTPSAQPVEHIYYPSADLDPGEYVVWVWFQQVCGRTDPIALDLEVTINGDVLRAIRPADNVQLLPDQRFEMSLRVTDQGGLLVNPGAVTLPSAQQRASQGGDPLMVYGQTITDTINEEVYARFYQFSGRANDEIVVRVERLTGSLDPILVLRDADERNLALNDDIDAGNQNAELTYTLPTDGRYVISVTRFGLRDGSTQGDYRLTLQRRVPGS